MLVQSGAQVALALGHFLRCFADVNKLVLPEERVDAAFLGTDAFCQRHRGTPPELGDKLSPNCPVQVENEKMGIGFLLCHARPPCRTASCTKGVKLARSTHYDPTTKYWF